MYQIHFAPLQGYTEDIYRSAHQEIFGGVETYTTPFIRYERGEVRTKDLRDLDPLHNKGVNLVPQVITDGGEDLKKLLEVIRSNSYQRVDINMGCPFPLQTRHFKGCGLLPFPERIREISEVIKANEDMTFSVKMRLGLQDKNEWVKVLPILNDTPLCHVTMHPRIASQQYDGELDMASFDSFLESCRHPVILNGSITNVDQIHELERLYGDRIHGIMIGRGLLLRPSLAWEYISGKTMDDRLLLGKVLELHERLMTQYERAIPDPVHRLHKLQSFWDYLEPLIGRKNRKKLQKAGNLKNYLLALREIR